MVQMERQLLGSILRTCLEISIAGMGSCGNEGWDQVGFCPNRQDGVGAVPGEICLPLKHLLQPCRESLCR